MELSQKSLETVKQWERAGFALSHYNREAVGTVTKKSPEWLHLGAGNIFRAFIANLQETLLNTDRTDKGIIVAEGFDYEIVEKIYRPKDNLSVLVTLKSDGAIEKTVIGSIVESLVMDTEHETDWQRLEEIFRAASLKMVSFTITEKGYCLTGPDGNFLRQVAEDMKQGPDNPKSYMGKLTALLYARYKAGAYPLALVSMDNCSKNGKRLYEAVYELANSWVANKLVGSGFLAYIADPEQVSFPWSMIDKITPRPDESVKKMLKDSGFDDVETLVTSKNTYIAPFVNAEEPQYLVIEDCFPNGKPPLEKAGVLFTSRETVERVEKMKVSTCLNPLHTTLAVFGCLLGYQRISEEMKNPDLRRLVEKIGYTEGLPVVVNPGIIDPKAFIDEVLQVRIPNPFMPDTPQRIATDTSQKLGVRFGETIKAYRDSADKDVSELQGIPLVLAGWCRYLMGVDDEGEHFTLSPDPMLEETVKYVEGISLGENRDFHKELYPLLSNADIFGVDLYEAGLGEKVEAYFAELVSGKGAVKKTLANV